MSLSKPSVQLQYLLHLPDDIIYKIFDYTPNDHLWALLRSNERFITIFNGSQKLYRRLSLVLIANRVKEVLSSEKLQKIQFRTVVIDTKINNRHQLDKLVRALGFYANCIETLEITPNFSNNLSDLKEIFDVVKNIKNLKLTGYILKDVESLQHPIFPELQNLEFVEFDKCDSSCFNAFKGHPTLTKVGVTNNDFTVKGFDHSKFIDFIKHTHVQELLFKGIGTSTFFDNSSFDFKILSVEAYSITFNWYIGLKDCPRTTFLQAQRGHLRHLTIHELPNDYDGEKVMRYILQEMKLESFNYGKISLIKNGKMVDVKMISANEVQLGSLYELMRHYRSIRAFHLLLNSTDVDSSEIEMIINPQTDLFESIKVFDVFDRSNYHRLFGLFLGLFRQLRNVEFLSIRTQDRNINVILEEFLPRMGNLKEIYLTSTAPRHERRFDIIQRCVPNLRKIWLAPEYNNQDTKNRFGENVEILEIDPNSINNIKPIHLEKLINNI